MSGFRGIAILSFMVLAACAGDRWPEPPGVDTATYQAEHQAWRDEQRAGLSSVLPIIGIWPLLDGETAFGSDRGLPIVLPAAYFPARAGAFRRADGAVTIVPGSGAVLRLDDGSTLEGPRAADTVTAGPIRLDVVDAGDERQWVMAIDSSHPAVDNPPALDAYPLHQRWRVSARFDAFDQPKSVRVPDVRGGFMQFTAVGELVFRLDGEQMRLTAFGEEGRDDLFVMFKDPTNESTTYRGYRIITPKAVMDGAWTVLDFNFALNPPCAYSKFTTCPLPPPENRLPVAIEAGLKRLPSAEGY
jgi:uncharacterized protein